MLHTIWRKNIVDPVLDLLRQGITAEKLALTLSLGAVIGIFPLIGSTTLLCTACALIFRLNLPAIQIANYAVFSLQLVFLVPLMHLGTMVFGADPLLFSVDEVTAMFEKSWWDAVMVCWRALLYAMGAWIIVSVPVALALYGLLKPVLTRLVPRSAPVKTS
jgi:hypothetical protein